nr:hypothetical protein [Tanacetum cinerariifolium]
MFDEYLEPPRVERSISLAPAVPVPVNIAGTPSSTTIDQDAPSPSHSPSSSALQSLSLQQSVTAEATIMEDNPLAPVDNDPFVNVFALEPSSKALSSEDERYRIYKKRTRRIMETIHVQFDELTEPMAPVHLGIRPAPNFLTPGQISSGLVPNSVPATPYAPPTNKELEILFQPMFDEYLEPPRAERPVSPAQAVKAPVN